MCQLIIPSGGKNSIFVTSSGINSFIFQKSRKVCYNNSQKNHHVLIGREEPNVVAFSDLQLNDALAETLGKLKIDFAFQPIFCNNSLKRVGYEH